jgi:hypothetical protein
LEQVPGSIQVFASALNVSEQELFAMMEKGTLLAKDVLPKVAKEFAKAARQGGALSEALKTVRVQQGRFFTQVQKAQDTIFKKGFGRGFAKLLKDLSLRLKELEPTLEAVGQAFEVVFGVVRELAGAILRALSSLGMLLKMFGFLNQVGGEFAESTVSKLSAGFLLMLNPLGRVILKLMLLKALIEEVIALSSKNIMGEVERRLGKDLGFGSDSEVDKRSSDKSSQKKTEPSLAETFFWSGPYATIDQAIGTNIVGGAKDILLSALEGIGFSVSNTITIDDSGNGSVDTRVKMNNINAQAQR